MSAQHISRERIAAAIRHALSDHDLPLNITELDQTLSASDMRGVAIFEQELSSRETAAERNVRQQALRSLDLSILSIHRMLGLGAWQARALGGLDTEIAGALFNLGIVLFDAALDRGRQEVREEALSFDPARQTGTVTSPEMQLLATVARRFMRMAKAPDLLLHLDRMRSAELDASQAGASARAQRIKSVEPFILMARLGGRDIGLARQFGRAIWIVDDLWDQAEDSESAVGRPALLQSVYASQVYILQREIDRLRAILANARAWPEDTRNCLKATIGGWIRMPVPQPLFAATIAPAC